MVTALLCAVAFVLCVLMTLHSLNGAGLAGCSAGSSCDAVLSSRWSLLFGFLPVSGLALAVYTAIAACLAFIAFSKDDELVRGAHLLLHLFCGAVCGAARTVCAAGAGASQSFGGIAAQTKNTDGRK